MKWWLARVETNVAKLNIIRGDPDSALARLLAAVDLISAGQDTGFVWGEYLLGYIHFYRGQALTQLGQLEDAISAYQEAKKYLRSTRVQNSVDFVAASQAHVGELHYALGRPGEGDTHLADALGQFNETTRALPDEVYTHMPLIVFLCMCPNPEMRAPERAVDLAERFIGDCESSGLLWRYLALAHYRTGDWEGAEEAVRRSRQLLQGGDALDLFLLAAIKHRAGDDEAARAALQEAHNALSAGSPILYDHIDPLRFAQFRAEVETLLGRASHERVEDHP